ncbi:hypothetical protein [Streptomyces sp. E-08]|uniref:hypothetical protein n=1 Tax=Streptomyces sp. E-08 TaxID=3404047 RepID=UPI003CEFEC68
MRASLGAGRPRTGATPDRDFPEAGAIDHERRYHPTYRDHLGSGPRTRPRTGRNVPGAPHIQYSEDWRA